MRDAVHEPDRRGTGLSALTITAIYAACGGLWILFSDALLHTLVADGTLLLELQTFKGWFFVAATGLMLFALIGRSTGAAREANDALRESERLLQSILDNSPVSIFVKDLEGRYQLVNRSFLERCNLSGREILGRTDDELGTPEQAETYRRHDREVIESNAPVQREDVVRLGGETHTYIAVKFPLVDSAGKPHAVCGISADITQRKQAEEQLHSSREQLRALSARLLSAREEERKRIAREIHDELGQALTGLIIELSWLEDKLALLPDGARARPLLEKTASMLRLTDATVESVRRIASELRPGLLDDFGLVAAIEWHAQEFEQRTGVTCQVSSDIDETILAPEQATALFRIAQEALTNVARHAAATSVWVRIFRDGDEVVLSVEDDGSGISEEKRSSTRSLGVIGMRERAGLLGGAVQLTGTRGGGTKVVARLPVAAGAGRVEVA